VRRVGLIGVGRWGPNLVRSFELTGRAEVSWICDLDAGRLAKIAERNPRVRTTQSVDELLADESVEAVAIVTPVVSHFELAKRALEAGKHLLVEKPLTRTAEEARELIRLAEEQDRILMTGHVFEYNASIRALRELVQSGALGDIHYLNCSRTNLGPVRTDVNAFWDLASHDISIMTFVLGRVPNEVTARGQAYLNTNVEDVAFATFSFDGGILAHVDVSWLHPRKVRRIVAVGSKKMAIWDDLDMQRPIQIFDRHVELPDVADTFLEHKTAVVDGGVHVPNIRLNQPLQAECEHFLDCLDTGERPQSDGESGLQVVLALEAATKSMAEDSRSIPIEVVARKTAPTG